MIGDLKHRLTHILLFPGAFASLFAAQMAELQEGLLWANPDSRLITFGLPRVGDRQYAAWHDMLIPPFQKLRVVHNADIVPHIPPKIEGNAPCNPCTHVPM